MEIRQTLINTTALHALPNCIKNCGIRLFPDFNCTLQNDCYCQTTGPLAGALVDCAISTCPTKADIHAGELFQSNACSPLITNVTTVLDHVTYTLFAIATLALLARLLSRWPRLRGAGFSYDDYIMILCYIPVIGTTIAASFESHYASSASVWGWAANDMRSFLRWFYATQCFYLAVTYLTKVSLVLLYLRIWPETRTYTPFRITCWVITASLVATWTASTLSTLFQCNPVRYAWDVASGGQGVCMDRQVAVYAWAGLNIAFDFVVLLLPIPRLIVLNVSTADKAGISACFLCGFIVTACSLVRITKLQNLSISADSTLHTAPVALWSLIEVYCSLICCCMPAIAGLSKRCWRIARNKPSTYEEQYSHRSSPFKELEEDKIKRGKEKVSELESEVEVQEPQEARVRSRTGSGRAEAETPRNFSTPLRMQRTETRKTY